jgi:predicted Rossmann fold nucleotide-binding protein DprA/Smf involved in DNA uptake
VAKQSDGTNDPRDSLDRLLRFRSPSRISPSQGGGISPLDLVRLPPDLQETMNLLMRHGPATAAEIAVSLQMDLDTIIDYLDTLEARGHIRRVKHETADTFAPILGRSRRPGLSSGLWKKLEND